ncbi:MAG: hypothetical protein KGR48_10975 [Alphaproteobacteria bacterium]|nr:hypothetical protein [Alphaproteobacteria bacterium]
MSDPVNVSLAIAFIGALLTGMALRRFVAERRKTHIARSAQFYILVMDIWAGDDPHAWLYSASAATQAELLALRCYDDPPKSMRRDTFISVSTKRVKLPCCDGGAAEGGTVHGMKHI